MANADTIEEWVDAPPAAGSGDGIWDERMQGLTERPGDWKKFGPYAAASITRSAKNSIDRLGLDPSEFELTTRTIQVPVLDAKGKETDETEEEVWLYARYLK